MGMAKLIISERNSDGVDRRGFLHCMAWAGTGMLWTIAGGVLASSPLTRTASAKAAKSLFFVQISDSHLGFNKAANPDVAATLRETIARINALPTPPAFVLHTGDLTHLAEPAQFDAVDQLLRELATKQVFYVPGEHDVLNDDGAQYRERFGKGTQGAGWYSFVHSGVHFIGLVNVTGAADGGLGRLGEEQLAWLARDLEPLPASTPIVVFAHVPLWSVYPQWGWATEDGGRALALMKRFGSVTVLNGHIHQVVQKVEGTMTFHTARSTAFPQASPSPSGKPGPLLVDASKLKSTLGLTSVRYIESHPTLAIVDADLGA
jgi:Icc protein